MGAGADRQVSPVGHLHDPAEIHDRHTVGDMLHHSEIVSDEQIGDATAFLQITEQIEDLRLDRDIKG